MKFLVDEIVAITGGDLLEKGEDPCLLSITTDSRNIGEAALFVPIRGERLDGHDYIESAIENGAKAVLTEEREAFEYYCENHTKPIQTAFIRVNNTVLALQKIAKAWRKKMPVMAIGVTGSVGKTTTREMISYALGADENIFKTKKNFNNKIGLPLTLLEVTDEYQKAVIEVGMNVPGELPEIASLCNLELAVITNIGDAHREYYGTREKIAEEKWKITEGFWAENKAEKKVLIFGDDPLLKKVSENSAYPVFTYGLSENNQYRAEAIDTSGGCFSFDFMKENEKRARVRLSVLGKHNIMNALAAMAVADLCGKDPEKAAEGLGKFTGFTSRLERITGKDYQIIDDTYNASPISMKSGLDVLESILPATPKGRRIAVLGDMLELGQESLKMHYEVGEYLAGKNIDLVLLVGQRTLEIQKALADASFEKDVAHADTIEEATSLLQDALKSGDIVYLKASNSMHLRKIAENLLKNE